MSAGPGRLDGKVCVITGVAGGIGAASAALFAREGARLVGVDLLEHSFGELRSAPTSPTSRPSLGSTRRA
jgi:NAD(P)-dependent dehydrogenase (short-subunit alcohol dehydrogenase family)